MTPVIKVQHVRRYRHYGITRERGVRNEASRRGESLRAGVAIGLATNMVWETEDGMTGLGDPIIQKSDCMAEIPTLLTIRLH